MLNPIRKPTTAGTTRTYEFEEAVRQFLVKNLSGGDITVSLEPLAEDVSSWLIPDGAWQRIPGYDSNVLRHKIYVAADATSATNAGVEIEAIEYQLPRR